MFSRLLPSLVLVVVLTGCVKRTETRKPAAPAVEAPATVTTPPPAAAVTDADTNATAAARFRTAGLLAFDSLWTETEIRHAVAALTRLAAEDRRDLPDSTTEAGVAFFRALRRATAEFHRLPSSRKVDFTNQFIQLAPLYISAARAGLRCDKELALLIGLEFEQADLFVQDRAFVTSAPPADGQPGTTSAWNPRGGDVVVYFEASQARIGANLRENLSVLGGERFFRPEARALALSYAARHLPNVCRALKLKGLRPILDASLRTETDPAVKSHYEALLADRRVL